MKESRNGSSGMVDLASGVASGAVYTEARPVSADEPSALPSLLRNATTWRLLAWWTIAYAVSSWVIEYFVSNLDPTGRITFLFAFNRVVYAFVWSGAIVVAIVATE